MVKMETLREIYAALGVRGAVTYVNSGNVVFLAAARDLPKLSTRIESAIDERFGFRPAVVLRTQEEMLEIIARNPFAGRTEIEPNRLLVTFFQEAPSTEARE